MEKKIEKPEEDKDEETYLYSHNYPENVSGQNYLGIPLDIYRPKKLGGESAIAERLARWKAIKAEIQTEIQASGNPRRGR